MSSDELRKATIEKSTVFVGSERRYEDLQGRILVRRRVEHIDLGLEAAKMKRLFMDIPLVNSSRVASAATGFPTALHWSATNVIDLPP